MKHSNYHYATFCYQVLGLLLVLVVCLGVSCRNDVSVKKPSVDNDQIIIDEARGRLQHLSTANLAAIVKASITLDKNSSNTEFLDYLCSVKGISVTAVKVSVPDIIDGIFKISQPLKETCSKALSSILRQKLVEVAPTGFADVKDLDSKIFMYGAYVNGSSSVLLELWKANPGIRLIRVYENAMTDIPPPERPLSNAVSK